MENKTIPVFMATDDNYLPFLDVSVISIKDHRSPDRDYKIYVLNTGLDPEGVKIITGHNEKGFEVILVDVSDRLKGMAGRLQLRDYYTATTYFRFFIQQMFPQYDKALYIDCDTVVLADVAELFDKEIGENYIGGVACQGVGSHIAYRTYVRKVLGIEPERNFNAGVMVINLKKFREDDVFAQFVDLLGKYKFAVIQDQDYLNVISKGKTVIFEPEWNAMPVHERFENPKLIHYTLTFKPWNRSGVQYEEHFWHYAEMSGFLDKIKAMRAAYTPEREKRDNECEKSLVALAYSEIEREDNYYNKYVLNK